MTGTVSQQVAKYIELRHGLGYRSGGIQDRYLRAFAGWMDKTGHHGPVPQELTLQWAAATCSADPCNPARRLTMVRGFLRHLSGLDGETEVPPPGLLGPTAHRRPPHVYSDAEIADLLRAAAGLPGRLRPHCYATLFGLLACTGMRIGEALALSSGDVNSHDGVITVRHGKRGRTRLVPLHPSTLPPLRDYADRRAGYYGTPEGTDAFFRTDRSDHVSYRVALHTFSGLRQQLGWTAQGRARPPRIHDLRHRMVVRRIQSWHADGLDVDRKIAVLATYLGHTDVSNLYWYLSAVPELLSIVAGRFEDYAAQPSGGRA